MIEEQAKVVALDGGFAEIVAERHSACGSCNAKSGCGTSLLANWLPSRRLLFYLPNDVDAKVGDTVIIGLEEGRLQKGSLLLYALPLSGLLLGAIFGERIFLALTWSSELGSVLFGLLGLTAALVAVRRISAVANRRGDAGVKLLRIAHRTMTISPAELR